MLNEATLIHLRKVSAVRAFHWRLPVTRAINLVNVRYTLIAGNITYSEVLMASSFRFT
jgi:hypothetical protein